MLLNTRTSNPARFEQIDPTARIPGYFFKKVKAIVISRSTSKSKRESARVKERRESQSTRRRIPKSSITSQARARARERVESETARARGGEQPPPSDDVFLFLGTFKKPGLHQSSHHCGLRIEDFCHRTCNHMRSSYGSWQVTLAQSLAFALFLSLSVVL